jgi:CxxC-x17-CxxC domain-containing protein
MGHASLAPALHDTSLNLSPEGASTTIMTDQTLTCAGCGTQFQFTLSEQEFYQSKDYSAPARCPDCRAARKAARDATSGYGAAARYGEHPTFPVICSQCGKGTQLPFQPRGDKPVYCQECYRRAQPVNGSQSSRSHSGGGSRRY